VTYVALFTDVLIYSWVLDVSMDFALHHCTTIVIFDVPLPTSLWHRWTFCKALLPKVLDGIIVGISQEIMQVNFLRMVF
jgi:hypothetical protein